MYIFSILEPGSPYCLSVRASGVNIKHFRVFIDERGKKFYLSNNVKFDSLEGLISHYHCKSPKIYTVCNIYGLDSHSFRELVLALPFVMTL